MRDRFESLLQELSLELRLPLHVDHLFACSLLIPPLVLQLQPDVSGEKLLLFTKIVELAPGRFREEVLLEALKANGEKDPRAGVFGYLPSQNMLTLHQIYPFFILSGKRLAPMISGFLELALSWKEAILSGRTSPQNLSQ